MSNSSWFGCCFTRANLSLGGSFERMPHFLFCFIFFLGRKTDKNSIPYFSAHFKRLIKKTLQILHDVKKSGDS